MNAVIKQMRDEDAAKLEVDQRRYAQLLELEQPSPAEVEELRELMRRLDKTHDQLQLDHRIIQDAMSAERTIKNGTSLDEQIRAAEKAKTGFYNETIAIRDAREKEAARLHAKSSDVQSKAFAARDAYYNLEKMVHIHPDLLRFRAKLPKP